MTARGAVRRGWALWAFAVALIALTSLLIGLNVAHEGELSTGEPTFLAVALAFSSMGALIAAHQPSNLVGWLFYAVGILFVVSSLTLQYGEFALVRQDGAWPLGREVAGLSTVGATAFALMAGPLLLLFPTGRLVSSRLRPVLWLSLAGGVFAGVTEALIPGGLEVPLDSFRNPYGIQGAGRLPEALNTISLMAVAAGGVAGAGSLVRRVQRARGIERQQLKWMAYAAAVFVVWWLAGIAGQELGLLPAGAMEVLFLFPVMALPVAAGIAILRYRLYDIDRIINRTLSYALLTACLAALYVGLVIGLQELLSSLSGGSDLAIAVTTLVVAALFLPARRRVQDVVDRRFNRRAYDAARTIDAFSTRLRDQIDLDTLRYELLTVVDETMQPAGASLWLRQP